MYVYVQPRGRGFLSGGGSVKHYTSLRNHYIICEHLSSIARQHASHIDGYSRFVTYLSCSNNNKADTAVQFFLEAYGIPSRIRSDYGGENLDVAQFMLFFRGTNRGSHLTGKSTGN